MTGFASRVAVVTLTLAVVAAGLRAQGGDSLLRVCRPTNPPQCVPPLPPRKPADLAVPEGGQPYFEFMVDQPVKQLPGSPAPIYPPDLKAARVGGEVLVQFVVDTSGHVEPGTIRLLKVSHIPFGEAVREALPNMLFAPARVRGSRVRQLVQQPFTFSPVPPR